MVKNYRTKFPLMGLQWTGDNLGAMRIFCGRVLGTEELIFQTPEDIQGILPQFLRADYQVFGKERITAIVWHCITEQWQPVYTGDTVIQGYQGAFFPVHPDQLDDMYEEV